jgi:hypothetical protein
MSKLNRRNALAAIGSLPALSIPAAAAFATDDPIFAAIEWHKVAFRTSQEAGRIRVHTVDAKWAPEYDPVKCKAAQDADSAATDYADDAANALTTVQPTTMAGVLALIHHVEAFNAGAFFLEPNPGDTLWTTGDRNPCFGQSPTTRTELTCSAMPFSPTFGAHSKRWRCNHDRPRPAH